MAQRELAKLASVLRGNLRCFFIEIEAVFRSGAVLDMTLPADWEMKTKPSALIAGALRPVNFVAIKWITQRSVFIVS